MQHLIIIVAGLYLALLAVLFLRVPINSHKSISFHVARTEVTIQLARWVMIAAHLLLLGWLVGWAIAELQLSWDFLIAFGLLCVFGALSGIIPFNGGVEQMRLHNAFAWMYVVLILTVDAMLFASTSGQPTQTLLLLVTALQGFVFLLFFSYRPSRRYFLFLQIAFLGLFWGALTAVTYLR